MKVKDLKHIISDRERIIIIDEKTDETCCIRMFCGILETYGNKNIKKLIGAGERNIIIYI